MTPTRASAPASAASTSSIAWTHAVSETAASIRSVPAIGPKRASDGKEDGLPIALQPNVEAQHTTIGLRDQGWAPDWLDQVEDGIIRVRVRFVGEIHPGHQMTG